MVPDEYQAVRVTEQINCDRVRESSMDYHQMTAPCGLDCFNCPMYLANGESLAQGMNIEPEKAVCKGCRHENGIIPLLITTEPCNAYKCIEQKNLEFCCECSDFPCDHLHPYADRASVVPHNMKVYNLCLIKKMGLETWAQQKSKSVRHTYFKENWKI